MDMVMGMVMEFLMSEMKFIKRRRIEIEIETETRIKITIINEQFLIYLRLTKISNFF